MTNLACISFFFFLSLNAVAGKLPQVIRFSEGELFPISLSKFNYNRIDVEGEKIAQVRFTAGHFLVDKSDVTDSDSAENALYIKPLSETPMTVFITTEEKHHFSLSVMPEEGIGKTVHFIANRPKEAIAVSDYSSNVDRMMHALLLNEIPSGFHEVAVHERAFFIQKRFKMQLLKRYQSSKTTAYVYRIQNVSKEMAALTSQLFKNPNIRTLVFSEKQLAPNQDGLVYSLIHGGA